MKVNKISIIGTVGIPAKYGGFETLTEYLTENLAFDYDMTVFCSSKNYTKKLDLHNNAKLKYVNLRANGIQSIPYDIISIFKSLRVSNTLLILGVSGCVVLPILKLISKNKIIVNIDGLEWKRDKWGGLTKRFLKFSERIAVKYADKVVTDNKVITDYVKKEYGVDSHLIAYGADHVTQETLSNELKEKYPFLKNDYAFKVCRIEPENNIHIILEAFSNLSNKKLVLIGNWNNSDYGKKLKKKYSSFENVFLLNPIYDQKILNQIRSNCSIYVHGHSAGGTNPSLVEAMYLKLPIFAFGALYNKETTGYDALYFDNALELKQLLEKSSLKDLELNAVNMRKTAEDNYTWGIISNKYSELF